jgi:hypothetical protein
LETYPYLEPWLAEWANEMLVTRGGDESIRIEAEGCGCTDERY